MTSRIDTLSPSYMGEDRIVITLDDATNPPRSDRAIIAHFDYGEADEAGGVVLPLILEIQPGFGNGDGYVKRVYRTRVPSTYTFRVSSPGDYLIVLRESGHNRWQGQLTFTVVGDKRRATNARI